MGKKVVHVHKQDGTEYHRRAPSETARKEKKKTKEIEKKVKEIKKIIKT